MIRTKVWNFFPLFHQTHYHGALIFSSLCGVECACGLPVFMPVETAHGAKQIQSDKESERRARVGCGGLFAERQPGVLQLCATDCITKVGNGNWRQCRLQPNMLWRVVWTRCYGLASNQCALVRNCRRKKKMPSITFQLDDQFNLLKQFRKYKRFRYHFMWNIVVKYCLNKIHNIWKNNIRSPINQPIDCSLVSCFFLTLENGKYRTFFCACLWMSLSLC